jgi:hypothetical protein
MSGKLGYVLPNGQQTPENVDKTALRRSAYPLSKIELIDHWFAVGYVDAAAGYSMSMPTDQTKALAYSEGYQQSQADREFADRAVTKFCVQIYEKLKKEAERPKRQPSALRQAYSNGWNQVEVIYSDEMLYAAYVMGWRKLTRM